MTQQSTDRSLLYFLWRLFKRKLRHIVTVPAVFLAEWTFPYLYVLYMWTVWKTSRVVDKGFDGLYRLREEHDGCVALLWHEEVLTVAWGYREFHGHTLATAGPSGRVIKRMLELCNYTVFQRSSRKQDQEQRASVVQDMIEHMKAGDKVIYGITVDGSIGPPYRMKRGGIIIARDCNKPIGLARTWYKRCLRLPTWDRMALPLPFNVIHRYYEGPFHVPEDAHEPEGLERFRRHLENALIALARRSYEDLGHAIPDNLVEDSELPAPTARPNDSQAVER